MAKPEHIELLKQGSEVWNKWFKKNLQHGLPDLSEADLSDVNLSECDLRGVVLRKAILIKADLTRARLNGANLSEGFLYRAILQETDAGGASLNAADISEANLQGVNLRNSYLIGAVLTRSNLNQAQLAEADLRGGDLRGADFRGTDLTGANFAGADLSGADLRDANLSKADFERANLSKAILPGARFIGARFRSTIFGSNDLSEVVGLESTVHFGPSILNIETIYRSKGKLPEEFLRGCGLSDLQIESAKLSAPGLDSEQVTGITSRIHQMYLEGGVRSFSCFISHGDSDIAFAGRLHDDLQENGVRCWLAPETMKTGDKFRSSLDDAIRLHEKLLIVLSENSLNTSWVEKEVTAILAKERQENLTILFPICLDENLTSAEQPWAEEIRSTRPVHDFSDKGNYQKAFERLLGELRNASRG